MLLVIFLKVQLFYNLGRTDHPYWIAHLDNLGMLKLSY